MYTTPQWYFTGTIQDNEQEGLVVRALKTVMYAHNYTS